MAVTLSSLYNEAYYLSQNPDVAAAVEAGIFSSGLDHWQQYGQFEGRTFSEAFDATVYAANNPDLAEAGLTTVEQLTLHYVEYGIYEGRNILSSAQFNAEFYAAQYPDLAAAGITDASALYQHYVNYGIAENRVASSFDAAAYLAANPDVAAYLATGSTIGGYTGTDAARYHYYNYGIYEGRAFTAATTATYAVAAGSNTVVEGTAVTFTVTSSVPLDHDVTLTYNISGSTNGGTITTASASDFTAITATVTIPAGSTTATFTVTPVADGVTEGLEGFTVTLFSTDTGSLATVATSGVVATIDAAAPDTAKTLTLTAASDNLTGGTANDTFNAVLSDGTTTLNAGDILAGGAGTDTLNINSTLTSTVTVSGVTSTGIEVISVQNLGSALTVDGTNLSGVTTITSTGSTAAVTVESVKNIVAASLVNASSELSISYQDSVVSGSADAMSVSVNGADAQLTVEGIESLTISATGSKSDLQLDVSELVSLTVTGTVALDLNSVDFDVAGTSDSTVATVNASAFSGGLTIALNTGEYVSVISGSGNDTISIDTLSTHSTVNGGAGTADVLAIYGVDGATDAFANVSNFEILKLSEDFGSLDLTVSNAINYVRFGTEQTGTISVASGATIDLADTENSDVTIAVANAATQTADALNIVVGTTTDSVTDGNTLTVHNVETLNIASYGSDPDEDNVLEVVDSTVKTIKITGTAALTLGGDGDTGGGSLTLVDASSFTGDLDVSEVTLAANATVLGGSGNDELSLSSGITSISGGAGNDTIYGGSHLNASDTIDGGAGTGDVLTASIGGLTATTGKLNVSNVERLSLTASSAATVDASGITGASVIALDGSANVSLTNLAAGVTLGLGDSDGSEYTGTVTVTLADATGTADTLSVSLLNTDDSQSATIKTTGVETLAISGTSDISDNNTLTLTNAAVTTVTVSGAFSSNLNLGTLNAATTTLDASAVTVGTVNATIGATTAATIKGGAGANGLTGGSANDTITIATGFDGNDTINGGNGTNDTLNATIDSASADLSSSFTVRVSNVENVNIHVADTIFEATNAITVTTAGSAATAANLTVTGNNSLISFTAATSLGSSSAETINFSGFAGQTDIRVAQDAIEAEATISGGSGSTDSLHVQVNNLVGGTTISGFESIEIYGVGTSSTFDVENVSGATTIALTGDEDLTLDNVTSGATIDLGIIAGSQLEANYLETELGLDGDRTITLNLASTDATTDALTVNINSLDDNEDTLTLAVDGVETINLVVSDAAAMEEDVNIAVTDADDALTTLNISGGVADTIFTLTNVQSSVTSIDAEDLAADLVITTRAGSSAMTITSGSGDDSFQMKNAADVLSAGDGTDTLTVIRSAPLGGIQIDLSSTSDQITVFNGSANSAAQTGFENVDLSQYTGNFGADVTGSSLANSITGTNQADALSGGAGADTLIGGVGADTLTGGAGADRFELLGSDTVTDFSSTQTDTVILTGLVAGDAVTFTTVTGTLDLSASTTTASFTATAATTGATITGGSGADSLAGDAGADSLVGGAGADTLSGGAGADTLTGGAGADSLTGGLGADSFVLAGSDTVVDFSSTQSDTVTLTGLANGDAVTFTTVTGTLDLSGSTTTASFTATAASTGATITGGSGADSLVGDAGADSLVGGAGADTLSGGAGADTLTGGAGADSLTGGLGADSLTGGLGADSFVLAGSDTVVDFSSTESDTVTVTALANGDAVTFTSVTGTLDLSASTTTASFTATAATTGATITGGSGADSLVGSDVADSLTGGAGADTLSGGAGADTLTGGAGNDSLVGLWGDDSLVGGLGNDTLNGGDGSDTMTGGDGGDNFVLGGNDTVVDFNSNESDTISWEPSGLDSSHTVTFTTITGSLDMSIATASLTATAATGGATITGGSGNDSLVGADGDDSLTGGVGDDTLTGGEGDDTLTGGDGADHFIFSATNGSDTIADFDTSQSDVLDFSSVLSSGSIMNVQNGNEILLADSTSLSTEGNSIAVLNNSVYVAEASGITNASTLATALADGGALDAVDVAVSSTTVLVVTNGDTSYIFKIVNDMTTEVDESGISLLGTVTVTGTLDTSSFSF
jgi:Ca2+-binding RTX toxin-like protein